MAHPPSTIRILIADDHDVVREGLKTMLAARADFEVCGEAATGREAVALLLGLSVKTADAHRANIMRKLDLHSVSELVLYAVRNQIVQA